MYYVINGYNAVTPVDIYCDIAYNKGEKTALIKQYKEYLKNKEIDMFKVASYRDNGILKDIISYQ